MAEASQEQNAAYFTEIVRPAIARFLVGLEQSTKGLDRFSAEGAAVALAATITFIKNMNWDLRFQAPLEIALEMVEKNIDPANLPYCRRAQAVVGDLDAFRNKPLPPLEDFRTRELSRKDVNRIVACVAVDYHRLCKVPSPEALRKVVGTNSIAPKQLEDFRDTLRRTRSGPKRELYDQVTSLFKDLPLKEAAAASLVLYQIQTGKSRKRIGMH
jgi:hypothetical protein